MYINTYIHKVMHKTVLCLYKKRLEMHMCKRASLNVCCLQRLYSSKYLRMYVNSIEFIVLILDRSAKSRGLKIQKMSVKCIQQTC